MTHTTLKVFVVSFSPEPGGTLSVTQRKNKGEQLKSHMFPSGVIKDFATLHDSEGRIVFIRVQDAYAKRHRLAQLYS